MRNIDADAYAAWIDRLPLRHSQDKVAALTIEEIYDAVVDDLKNELVTPTARPGWIPVTERVPDPFKSVLITFRHDQYGTKTAKQVVTVGMGFHNGKIWSSAISSIKGYKTFTVLAWMPLPEIYRGEER